MMTGARGKEPSPFVVVDGGEPHAFRRRAILEKHPQVRRLMGYDRRTAAVILVLVGTQLGFAAWVGTTALWGGALTFVVLSYVVGGVLNHWLAMGIHECSHHLAARTPRANRWLAIVANAPGVVPSAMTFWRHHQDHHTYLGIEGRDNDLPSRWEVRWTGSSPVRKALWLFTLPLTAAWTRGFLRRPDRWERINVAVQLTIDVLILALFGWKALLYLLLSTLFGNGLHPVAAHWVHEHYLFEGRQETYSYYGPLNWVTFHVGLHVEHHDFFNIPGWKLPQLRRIASEFYESEVSHRSWTAILARFLFDPRITHESRIARSESTFRRARRQRVRHSPTGHGRRMIAAGARA